MSERKEMPAIGKTTYHIGSIVGSGHTFHLHDDADYEIEDIKLSLNGEIIHQGRVEIGINDGVIEIETSQGGQE